MNEIKTVSVLRDQQLTGLTVIQQAELDEAIEYGNFTDDRLSFSNLMDLMYYIDIFQQAADDLNGFVSKDDYDAIINFLESFVRSEEVIDE